MVCPGNMCMATLHKGDNNNDDDDDVLDISLTMTPWGRNM